MSYLVKEKDSWKVEDVFCSYGFGDSDSGERNELVYAASKLLRRHGLRNQVRESMFGFRCRIEDVYDFSGAIVDDPADSEYIKGLLYSEFGEYVFI